MIPCFMQHHNSISTFRYIDQESCRILIMKLSNSIYGDP